MFCPLHSSNKQRTGWKASLQSTQPLWRIQRMHSWNAHLISQYVKAIKPQFWQCQACFITQLAKNSIISAFLIFMSCTEERLGAQKSTEIAPWCKQMPYLFQWPYLLILLCFRVCCLLTTLWLMLCK